MEFQAVSAEHWVRKMSDVIMRKLIIKFSISMRSCKPGPGTLGEHMIKARNSERQPEELYLDTATLVAHVQAENA